KTSRPIRDWKCCQPPIHTKHDNIVFRSRFAFNPGSHLQQYFPAKMALGGRLGLSAVKLPMPSCQNPTNGEKSQKQLRLTVLEPIDSAVQPTVSAIQPVDWKVEAIG